MVDRHLSSGPAKLCQAFGIGRADDGADLVTGDKDLVIADDGTPPPARSAISGRVGVASAAEVPWRWWVEGDLNVSRGTSRVTGSITSSPRSAEPHLGPSTYAFRGECCVAP